MNKTNRRGIIYIVIGLLLMVICAVTTFSLSNNHKVGQASTTKVYTTTKVKENETSKKEKIKKVNLIAVGDNLGSDISLKNCRKNGKYDFTPIFKEMKNDIKSADISIINQETIMGGKVNKYQGYPNFNTPDAMGKAIVKAGFDIVQQASNHSYDNGLSGIKHDINFWSKYKNKVLMVGLNKTKSASKKIPIIEKNGIKIAVLNYTFGLNGYRLPSSRDYTVNLMDSSHWKKVKNDIKKAEKLADFTIVLPHWGTEYVQPNPISSQIKWAKMMTKSGADLIIGTHPHVIEKIKWIKVGNKKALCYYSLGNFNSGQVTTWKAMLGAMAKLTIEKKGNKTYIVKNTAGVVPLITHYDTSKKAQTTYKLSNYTNTLAKQHDMSFSLKTMKNIAKNTFGKWIKK